MRVNGQVWEGAIDLVRLFGADSESTEIPVGLPIQTLTHFARSCGEAWPPSMRASQNVSAIFLLLVAHVQRLYRPLILTMVRHSPCIDTPQLVHIGNGEYMTSTQTVNKQDHDQPNKRNE